MEYDQRVIIKFLWNERANARQIVDRLQEQFAEHFYQLWTVRFWIVEIWRGRQDLHDEIHSGRPPLDDLDGKLLAILEKSPFESSHSIAERLLVAKSTMLRYLHEFIEFKSFHLRYVPHLLSRDFSKNERGLQKIYCHSCMLPNVIAGIILWLVMSRGFSLIHHHIGCVLCREMMWLQNRDSKFRAKSICSRLYGIRLGSMLSTDFQMIPKWIATISWQIYLFP
jgi:hypothetical protein